mmetsp:Transcript_8347/g.17911  ORF Transcript_8347/g.17911 Transcript_8347/m.17911 type:complete len:125 (-) Transcript_8347:702-1076(-)
MEIVIGVHNSCWPRNPCEIECDSSLGSGHRLLPCAPIRHFPQRLLFQFSPPSASSVADVVDDDDVVVAVVVVVVVVLSIAATITLGLIDVESGVETFCLDRSAKSELSSSMSKRSLNLSPVSPS